MSVRPDFTIMTTSQLRAYILEHRHDEEALQAYLDRRHFENPDSRVFSAEDDVADAIAEYLKTNRQKEAS